MSYKQQDFDIQFHTQTVRNRGKNKDISIRFKIVFQTSTKKIEKYCLEHHSNLLQHKQFSADERAQLIIMRQYIENNLTKKDLNYIHEYFYDRRWFDPFVVRDKDKISSIEVDTVDAKMWTDDLPYLEVNGTITVYFKELFDEYVKKGYHSFEMINKQRITSRIIKFVFARALPLILTYRGHNHIKGIFTSIFEDYIKSRRTDRRNIIKKEIEKRLKIEDIHLYRMKIDWKFTNTIEVNINDTARLLKLKAKESVLPIIGGFVIYDALKKRR